MMTDEIFAVAAQEDRVSRSFFAGLATLPYLGWSAGTLLGAILGSILPDRLMSALSLAIYGMFVAIVVPEMQKSRLLLQVVILAIILSCAFYYIPFLSSISSGITITIVAISAVVVGAILFHVDEEKFTSNFSWISLRALKKIESNIDVHLFLLSDKYFKEPKTSSIEKCIIKLYLPSDYHKFSVSLYKP